MMVFHIVDYAYLPFWWAAWNAVMHWEALEMNKRWASHRITQNDWVVGFARKKPLDDRWREVALIF